MKFSLIPANLHCLLPSLILHSTERSREPPIIPNNAPRNSGSSIFANVPTHNHSLISPNPSLGVFTDVPRVARILRCPCVTFPPVANQGHGLSSRSHAHIVNKCLFYSYLVPVSFLFAFLWLLLLLFNSGCCGCDFTVLNGPKQSAKALASVLGTGRL